LKEEEEEKDGRTGYRKEIEVELEEKEKRKLNLMGT